MADGDRAVDTVFMPFTTSGLGGSHISGALLGLGQMQRYGVRVIVAAPAGAKVLGIAQELGLEGMELADPARSRHPPLYDVARTPGRARLLRRLGPRALVHTNDLAALQAWGLAARLARRPIVHHNRAFDRRGRGMRLVFGLADHVICVSHACRRAINFLPEERRSVLWDDFTTPAEVDHAAARTALLSEFGFPGGRKLVGFVGNFWQRKRPDFFLEAAGRIAAKVDDVRFVLFGVGGDLAEDDLRRQASALGLDGRVLFAGFRRPPELNLASLDTLLMPTLLEPCTRSLIEAVVLGVPYVASDDAGSTEIHAQWGGGRMVAPDAPPDAYADAVLRLLDEGAAVVRSLSEREAIRESLLPVSQACNVMDIYRRVA